MGFLFLLPAYLFFGQVFLLKEILISYKTLSYVDEKFKCSI